MLPFISSYIPDYDINWLWGELIKNVYQIPVIGCVFVNTGKMVISIDLLREKKEALTPFFTDFVLFHWYNDTDS